MDNKEKIRTLKIGTRGSALAMVQTHTVRDELKKHYPDLDIQIVEILTSGDWKPSDGEVRLSEAEGGKGLFAKEIEQALLSGEIDIAVHSMKDMDSFLPEGLVINHMLPRQDVRDVLLLKSELRDQVKKISDLPDGALIGSASVRRAAFLLGERPDLKIVPLRGNVQTRINKVRAGQVDATFLAIAGLNRLFIAHEADIILDIAEMLPAAGQGAVGIEMREGEEELSRMLDKISCIKTVKCVKAERAALQVLDGSCRSPIGAYALLEDVKMHLSIKVSSLDGQHVFEQESNAEVRNIEDAQDFGSELGLTLKNSIPIEYLS